MRYYFLFAILICLLAVRCVQNPKFGSPSPRPKLTQDQGIQTLTPTPEATLRSLAELRGIWIGAAVDAEALMQDQHYADLLAREYNLLTTENVMKFVLIHPERERYDFSLADQLVDFAIHHNMVVRGHTLVWDYQLPEWILQGQFTREEWMEILRDHIYTVVTHYRGKVIAWDVVNEAFDDQGKLRDTIWLKNIGPEYIPLAFQWAHEADAQAKLFYNDNRAEGLNPKSDAVYQMIQGLLDDEVPIHGVGFQLHTGLGTSPAPFDIAANMQRLAALGIDVHITEMDVRIGENITPEKLQEQAKIYGDMLRVCLEADNCRAFVVWGLTDRFSWIPELTGAPDAPLPFDEAYQPKLAYFALLDALEDR